VISDENGSKLTFISGAVQPLAKIDQLKGKTQTPETIEVNLADLIDVKGMKAMGNRISQHTVQSVVPIASEELVEAAETAVATVTDDEEELTEAVADETAIQEEIEEPEPVVRSPKIDAPEPKLPVEELVETQPKEEDQPQAEPVQAEEKPVETQHKKVDFEITNPDDIEIDDKGQLGLF